MMYPARRFYSGLLIIGLLGFSLSQWSTPSLGIGLILGLDLLWFLLAVYDSWRVTSDCIQIERSPLNPLSIGRENTVAITVKSAIGSATVEIEDDYPEGFAASTNCLRCQLSPQQSQILSYTVLPNKRGTYRWGKIGVRQLGYWGLSWYQWRIGAPQTVPVYPDLMALKSLTIRLTQSSSGSLKQLRQIGLGTEFRELRDYQAGDDLRYVDWKASARRGMPLVRVLEPEREQTVMILLDRGRLMTAWIKGLQRFDWGLNTALALTTTALHRGDRVGIGVFDRQMVTWIPPQRGLTSLPQILDQLAGLAPVLLEPDYLGAVTHVVTQQVRRALVVCITDLVDLTASKTLLTALMHLLPRYLPFCIALRDPQVDANAQQATVSVSESYQKAVALNLLQQRRLALKKLQERGGLVVDAPADQVSEQVVTRYLTLKARQLL